MAKRRFGGAPPVWLGLALLANACADSGVDETVIGFGGGGEAGSAGGDGIGGNAGVGGIGGNAGVGGNGGNGMGGCGGYDAYGGGCGFGAYGGTGGVGGSSWTDDVMRLYPPGDAACSDAACLDGGVCVDASGKSCRCPGTLPAPCSNLTFQTLPFAEGTQTCIAQGTSGDGSVNVGMCWSYQQPATLAANHAVVWTSDRGAEVLNSESEQPMEAHAVSADGTVLLWSSLGPTTRHAYVRRLGGPAPNDVRIQSELGDSEDVFAAALSADGSVVVGTLSSSGAAPFRWTEASGVMRLPVGELGGSAQGVSDHGEFVVGSSSAAPASSVALRWTAQGDAEELALPAGVSGALAYSLSADGSVIVGYTFNPVQAVRWTAAGVEVLAASYSAATLVTTDGQRVFGYDAERAWMWDEAHGMRTLEEILGQAGSIGPDWIIYRVSDVSADGNVIVGTAKHRADPEQPRRSYAFRARLPAP